MEVNKRDFRIPIEAVGHYLVAKFTPMTKDGESGESSYAVTEKYVDDSATQKARKVRGKNKNKKIAALKSGEKMEIEFYNNRAAGKNHRYWSRHLGKIVRDKHICPIQVKTWKELTELDKQHMWDSVKECFFSPSIELYREHTLEHMGALWTAWRSSLNVDYVRPCKTKAEVLKNVPQGFNAKEWDWLVTNKFLTDEFQKIINQNSNNRVNGVMPHRTGSMPHRQLIHEMVINIYINSYVYFL
ncbi:uncharacterized protein [Primulina huaijiensis]|uniref:uncharacterized protein n=1 Tax=Primulina huaijiensis TaxID=1492673 RepID=UPI003CC73AEF